MSWRYVPSHQNHYNSPHPPTPHPPPPYTHPHTPHPPPPPPHPTPPTPPGAACPVGVKLSEDSYVHLCRIIQALLEVLLLLGHFLSEKLEACCQTFTHCSPDHLCHMCVNPGPLLRVEGWRRGDWSGIWWPGHWLGSSTWGLRSRGRRVKGLRLGHYSGYGRGGSTCHTLSLLTCVGGVRWGCDVWHWAPGGWTHPHQGHSIGHNRGDSTRHSFSSSDWCGLGEVKMRCPTQGSRQLYLSPPGARQKSWQYPPHSYSSSDCCGSGEVRICHPTQGFGQLNSSLPGALQWSRQGRQYPPYYSSSSDWCGSGEVGMRFQSWGFWMNLA